LAVDVRNAATSMTFSIYGTRTVLGYDLRMTMIYTHVLNRAEFSARSPADRL
jgi:hypothetical protein